MASESTQASLIPPGYTFIGPSYMISNKAKEYYEELMMELDKRDPDMHNMYIYNDFFGYAQLDLLGTQLRSIHSRIAKKDYTNAFYRLEALTFCMETGALGFPMVDDGEQVELVNRLYGACLVSVLRHLNNENKLDTQHFPNLETVLRLAAEWGDAMAEQVEEGCDYRIVCRGIGKRLFADKSEEISAVEKARVEEWISTLPANDQVQIRESLREEEDERKNEESKHWYEQGEASEALKSHDLALSTAYKQYREYMQEVPTVPLRGPSEWDLTKWSAQEKAPFLFDKM
ncbi:hypothetical protein K474DRAFT_1687985 [Panus rudis PR-1116 ss-1]|nr:hypothetical protein K474DRAFT_1687985 [Panus rudis PR-1116 ss-1]